MSTWQVVPGTTVPLVYRWGAAPLIYVPVVISNLTPLRLTATAHGIPDGWPVAVPEMDNLPDLEAEAWPPSECDYQAIHVVDANTLEFNGLDAARTPAVVGGLGVLAYQTPMSLSGSTGTFTIATPITLVITAVLDNSAKTITVTLTSAETAAYPVGAIYAFSILITDSGGNVTQLDAGSIEVVDATSTC